MTRYDYAASKENIIAHVRSINEAELKGSSACRTREQSRLFELSRSLRNQVKDMRGGSFSDLKDKVNEDLTITGEDGLPVVIEDRYGSYDSTLNGLMEIANVADSKAKSIPSSRAKFALPAAAKLLLHLMYECDMDKPSLYDKGIAVLELKDVCERAGLPKADETYRNAISRALNEFEPGSSDIGNYLVMKQ